jgi:hypothetical protein
VREQRDQRRNSAFYCHFHVVAFTNLCVCVHKSSYVSIPSGIAPGTGIWRWLRSRTERLRRVAVACCKMLTMGDFRRSTSPLSAPSCTIRDLLSCWSSVGVSICTFVLVKRVK